MTERQLLTIVTTTSPDCDAHGTKTHDKDVFYFSPATGFINESLQGKAYIQTLGNTSWMVSPIMKGINILDFKSSCWAHNF